MKSLGHQQRGRGRGGSPTALLIRLLKRQRRAGQAFTFHSVWAGVPGMGKPCDLFHQGGYSPIGETALYGSVQ